MVHVKYKGLRNLFGDRHVPLRHSKSVQSIRKATEHTPTYNKRGQEWHSNSRPCGGDPDTRHNKSEYKFTNGYAGGSADTRAGSSSGAKSCCFLYYLF